jgi:multidrug efflux pump subunit AcrB
MMDKENIYRRWLIDNKITIATAIDAVREVGNPTILATFTVVAALVPMAALTLIRRMLLPSQLRNPFHKL